MFQLERTDFRNVPVDAFFMSRDWIYKKMSDRTAMGTGEEKIITMPLIAKVTLIKQIPIKEIT